MAGEDLDGRGTASAASADPLSDTVGSLLGALRAHGFEAGYYRAIRDVLSDLILMTEQFIHEHPDAPTELRRLIYGFEEVLEKRYRQLPSENGMVEGGLGI
jgi:hypothetical protein